MRRIFIAFLVSILFLQFKVAAQTTPGTVKQIGNYVVIGWNDLGMHCISPRFAEMAILPPYNNLHVIIIRKGGEEPAMVVAPFQRQSVRPTSSRSCASGGASARQ